MEKSNKRVADHLLVVWKRKWLILLLLALGTGGAVAYALNEEETFSYTLTVEIAKRGGILDGELANLAGLGQQSDYAANLLVVLDSRYVKEQMYKNRIANALDPQWVPEFLRPPESDDEAVRAKAKQEALAYLERAIRVGRRSRGSSLVDITVEGPDPEALPKIARAYWDEFVQMQELIEQRQVEQSIELFRKQRDDAQRKLAAAETTLQEWLQNAATTPRAIRKRVETLSERVSSRAAALDELKSWLNEHKRDYEEISTAVEERGEEALVDFFDRLLVTSNESIANFEHELSRSRLYRDRLEEKYGSGHQDVAALRRQIDEIQMMLGDRKLGVLKSFLNKYESEQERETALAADLEKTQTEAARFEQHEQELDLQEATVAEARAEYERHRNQYDSVFNYQQNQDNTSLTIRMQPEVDRRPISPNVPLITIAGIMLGLAMGVGLAYGLELLDDSLRTEDDIDRFLQLPCLGIVHAPESRRGGDAAVDLASVIEPRSIFAEEFRSIRTSLGFTFDRRRERHYSMMVTSFEVREGKSTVSTNLSTVIAASGLRTLLIDGDMRNPRLHRTFQLENEAGLSDVLRGTRKLDDVVEATDIPHLSVLSAGRIPENPAELLEGPSMRQLLQELSAKYDRVVFDTPPAGAVTDPMVLGKVVDASILVAAAGRAKRRHLKRTVKTMRSIGVRIAGVIINEMRPGRKRYYRKYFHLYSARPEERNIG